MQRFLTFLLCDCGLPYLVAWFILAVDPGVRKAARDFRKATKDLQKFERTTDMYRLMNKLIDDSIAQKEREKKLGNPKFAHYETNQNNLRRSDEKAE